MFARVASSAFLALLFLGPTAMSEDAARVPGNPANGLAESRAVNGPEKQMEVGRHYASRGNHIGAINRFKVVVTRFPSSPAVDEALFRLVDSFLQLGIRSEAQTATAVLDRKFPQSHWRFDALNMLKAAGLEPAEDEKSWISPPFE